MESRHPRLGRGLEIRLETIFAGHGLSLKSFRSRHGLQVCRSLTQAYFLESWNIAKIWLSKTSVIQRVSSVLHLQEKDNQKRSKNARNSKKIQLRNGDDIVLKNLLKSTNFEVPSLDLESWVAERFSKLGGTSARQKY